jgi:hypothetical protein
MGDLATNVLGKQRQVRHPAIDIAHHVRPFTLADVARPCRCKFVVVRTKAIRWRCLEEPQGTQDVALPQRLFVVPRRTQIVFDEPSDSPLLCTAAARIRQCSTRERDAVDIGENGISAGSSCIGIGRRHWQRNWQRNRLQNWL